MSYSITLEQYVNDFYVMKITIIPTIVYYNTAAKTGIEKAFRGLSIFGKSPPRLQVFEYELEELFVRTS